MEINNFTRLHLWFHILQVQRQSALHSVRSRGRLHLWRNQWRLHTATNHGLSKACLNFGAREEPIQCPWLRNWPRSSTQANKDYQQSKDSNVPIPTTGYLVHDHDFDQLPAHDSAFLSSKPDITLYMQLVGDSSGYKVSDPMSYSQ